MRRITALIIAVGLLVFGFGGGIFAGYRLFDGETTIVKEETSKGNGTGIIAVVSNDYGVETKDGIVNYGDAFINQLDSSIYVHTLSATDAEIGVENGEYDAVVTFPSSLSEQIVKNDYEDPYKIQIRYYISSDLDDKSKLEAHDKIIDLYTTFNDNLSYSYIKAVFEQVDLAQYSADKVFSNDKSSIALARKLAADNYMKGLEPRTIEEKTPKDNTVNVGNYPYLNPNSSNGKNFSSEANDLYNKIYNDACDKVYGSNSGNLGTCKEAINANKDVFAPAMKQVSSDAKAIDEQISDLIKTLETLEEDGETYKYLQDYLKDLTTGKDNLRKFSDDLVAWSKNPSGSVPDPKDYWIPTKNPEPVDNQIKNGIEDSRLKIKNRFASIYNPSNNTGYLLVASNSAQVISENADKLYNTTIPIGGDVKKEADNTIKNTSSGDGKALADLQSDFVGDVSKFVSASDQAQKDSNAYLAEAYKYYSESMANLQKDTSETYAKESKSLEDALKVFLKAAEAYSDDTRKKLSIITGMFKDSRDNTGSINNEVMQFLIQPVELIEEQ